MAVGCLRLGWIERKGEERVRFVAVAEILGLLKNGTW